MNGKVIGIALVACVLAGAYLWMGRETGRVEPSGPAARGAPTPLETTLPPVEAGSSAPPVKSVPFIEEPDPSTPSGLPVPEATDHGFRLTGRVLAEDKPVAKAVVRLCEDAGIGGQLSQMGDLRSEVLTDETGQFSFADLVPGERMMLRVLHADYAPALESGIDAAVPASLRRLIRLRPCLAVAGRVQLRDGGNADGVIVAVYDLSLQSFDPEDRLENKSLAAADGSFEVRGLGAGMKQVVAWREDLSRSYAPVFDLQQNKNDISLDLNVGRQLLGRIVGPDGATPVPKARLILRTIGRAAGASTIPSVVTAAADEKGEFRVVGLSAGAYDGWATAPGYLNSVNQTLDAGATSVTLVLRAAPRAEGQVVEAESGKPISEFTVFPTGNPDFVLEGKGRSFRVKHPEGRFSIPMSASGSYHLVVRAPGRGEASVGPLGFTDGQTVADIQVKLGRGIGVIARVEAPDGKPLAGATVSLLRAAPVANDPASQLFGMMGRTMSSKFQAQTDAQGMAKLSGLRAGNYEVTVAHLQFSAPEARNIVLVDGQDHELEVFRTIAGATLKGVVLSKDGKPDAKARVALQAVSGIAQRREAATDGEGRFELTGVVPGDYRLLVMQRDGQANLFEILQAGSNGGRVVTLRAGEVLELNP